MQENMPQGPTRVLLVEDDAELRALLAGDLRAAGFHVDQAGSVVEAQRMLARARMAVVILDVQLPDGSGFAVASHLSRHRPGTGIIMLSRHGDPSWRVAGLDVGADVYLPKPLEGEVLCAAVRSLVRRLHAPAPEPTAEDDGGWLLGDDGWRLLAPGGAAVALGSGERVLLQALAAAAGRPVSRQSLQVALAEDAGDEVFGSHRLDMLVHRLRRKVERAGLPPLPLRAIRGQGLVLLRMAGAVRGGGTAPRPPVATERSPS